MTMSILHVNNSNFDSVKTSDKPVLLDFYADWCGPCRMVAPVVEQIASIPTLVVLKDGKVISQSAGARPKADILALLERA